MIEGSAKRALWDHLELPTWGVFVAVYGGWASLMYFGEALPWWLFCPLGAVLIGWHGNLQHELMHGHPTRWQVLNNALGWAPLGLWMPYHVYREGHLRHHAVDHLTQPGEDPETYYYSPDRWAHFGHFRRAILIANNTFSGRILIGPMLAAGQFFRAECVLLLQGNFSHVRGWFVHIALAGVMLYVLETRYGIASWYYIAGVAYPGLSLALVRSFLEHKPSGVADERTVIVEAGLFWRHLFLNNNLHVVHHDDPGLPWYRIPAVYRAGRAAILERNGGYLFNGYGDVIMRYLFRPKDLPVHPG